NPHARNMPRSRRFQRAIADVLDNGLSIRESAKEWGVSRQALGPKVAKARQERQDKVERAKAALAEKTGRGPLGLNERRRVPPFEEFDKLYWGNWKCPDCGVHHAMPDFHKEIISAVEGLHRRILINTPPYHSKSTLVTIKHTVYMLCKNPNHRRIIVSESTPFARTFVGAIQNLLTNEEMYEGSLRNLIEDWGPFRSTTGNEKWTDSEFVVAGRVTAEKDPSVLAMGWGKQIYGRRADDIVFDDIATLNNQINPDQVQKMLGWIDKMALSRIGKSGKAIWIGTRVNAGDIYSTLQNRPSYKVIRFPCILDDATEKVLWPEHFPYSQALIHRDEMSAADFQLVYQNVDVPGEGAAFTPEMVEACKDTTITAGQYPHDWRLIAGLDPAGANTRDSGYTALVIVAFDTTTGQRQLVWAENHKAWKSHQVKDRMLELSDAFPIFEWRVEANGLQSQIYQYDQELVRALGLKGIRIAPHYTQGNKWDPQWGVESLAPFFNAGMFTIPWGNAPTQQMFQPLIEQMIGFPMAPLSDLVMALWFADIAVREVLRRDHLPLFDDRHTRRWPNRVRRRRRIVDFHNRAVKPVPLHEQRPGLLSPGQMNYRRMMVGGPTPHSEVRQTPEPERPTFANVAGRVGDRRFGRRRR
ncbi:MAG: hypothetical protein D6746_05880, partial [Bacteroidetes bacterium]